MSEYNSNMSVKLKDSASVFESLLSMVSKNGLPMETRSDSSVVVSFMESTVEFERHATSLDVAVNAPNEQALSALRQLVITHISEIIPDDAEDIRWSGEKMVAGLPEGFRKLTVLNKVEVFPGMVRITFSAENLERFRNGGVHFGLLIPANPARKPVWPQVQKNAKISWAEGEDKLGRRAYTIQNLRVEAGEVDVDFVLHADGVATDWVRQAKPGDIVGMIGPVGRSLPDVSRNLLIAGDMTALPAIARILDHLGETASGHVVVLAPQSAVDDGYFPETSLNIICLDPEAPEDEFMSVMRTCWGDEKPLFGWFAGETKTAQSVRKFFKDDLKLTKECQFAMPYWVHDHEGG